MPEQDKDRESANPQSNLTDTERRRKPGQVDDDLQGQDPDREEAGGRDMLDEGGGGQALPDDADRGRQGQPKQPESAKRNDGGRAPGSENTDRNRSGQQRK
jgi:hypothetical protein